MDGKTPTTSEFECRLVWRLARNHGWSRWTSADGLVAQTVPTNERGRIRREVLPRLRDQSFVIYDPERGYRLRGDTLDQVALYLRDDCGYAEFRVEATVSHFDGFEN